MVVDASVWVSRLVPHDAHHQRSRHWFEQHLLDGGLVIGPMLLLAEVAGAIARRATDPRIGERTIQTILRTPGLRLVTMDADVGVETARVASSLRIRGADATYVALAHALNIPLVTWDDEMHARASGHVRIVRP